MEFEKKIDINLKPQKTTTTTTTEATPSKFDDSERENYDGEEEKTIFLTFNDGPVDETKRVVELLKVGCRNYYSGHISANNPLLFCLIQRYNVPATFFVSTGKYLNSNDTWKGPEEVMTSLIRNRHLFLLGDYSKFGFGNTDKNVYSSDIRKDAR